MLMKIAAIIGQLALVRLLAPELFGIFALISFILNISELFTDLGLSMTIIQKKTCLTSEELSSIHYVKLFMATFICCLLFVFAPNIHFIYNDFGQIETLILRILSITLIIKSARSVVTSIFERELKYNIISAIDLSGMILYYITAVFLAIFGFGIWSFVWALLVKELIETILSWIKSDWLPGVVIKISLIIPLIRVGSYYQMSFITGFIHQATIPIVAGVLSTPYYVGLLDWSSNAASIPRTFAENVGRVSFASFSKMQDEKETVSRYINKSFIVISFISLYFVIATIAFGKELISFLLTDRWLPALPALYWFVSCTFFLNGTGLLGNLVLALGKTKLLLYTSLAFIVLEYTLCLILFNAIGFTGIAMANFISIFIMFIYLVIVVRKAGIKISFSNYILKALCIGAITFTIGLILNMKLDSNLLSLFLKLIATSMLYLLLFKLFLPEVLTQFLKVIKSVLKK